MSRIMFKRYSLLWEGKMSLDALKKIYKNKYFRAIVNVALAFLIAFSLLFCLRLVLGVEYPLLVVSSGSMMPTLNIGDLIIAQSIDPSQINADKLTGDILVFRDPRNLNELIVHRAVRIYKGEDNHYLIVTSGDATRITSDQFSPWDSSLLVGKVIMRIPYIGNITLFFYSEKNLSTIILFLTILVLIALIVFTELSQEENSSKIEKKKTQKSKLYIIYVITINVLIITFMIFSLWGSLAFWQPGASSSNKVMILGMYCDLQFHKMSYERMYGKEVKAYLSLGFMTYRIDCQLDEGVRPGVPTFSWFQFSLLLLILFDGWEIFNLIYPYLEGNKLLQKRGTSIS